MQNKVLPSFGILMVAVLLLLLGNIVYAANLRVSPSSLQGWTIAPDGTVPVTFGSDYASTGTGSLQFGPISGANPANKFIMFTPYSGPTAGFGISYDFYVGSLSANHFYMNIYVDDGNAGTPNWYDCRYDYVPSGAVGSWNTFNVTGATIPTNVTAQGGATCSATLGGLAANNNIMYIAINGGQSTAADAGLFGAFDNIVITTSGGTDVYDFEPTNAATSEPIPLDDRINNLDYAAPIAAYGQEYGTGNDIERGLHIYDIWQNSKGTFIWQITPEQIAQVNSEPSVNTLIAETVTNNLVIYFWRLSSGEYQLNVIQPDGKMYVIIFTELITGGDGYTSFEYLMQ